MKTAAALLLAAASLFGQAKSAAPSALDKSTLEAYLRYSELWVPQVTVTIDDPKPSATLDNFFDVWVHLAYNGQTKDEMYFVSKDGKNVVKGEAFDISKSPFQANVNMLRMDQKPSFGGGDNAIVNLVVFGDFQCPVCQKEDPELRKNIVPAFGDKVRVYFSDFPLIPIHPWALKASIIGRCMYHTSQDAFWAYHDWVYDHQKEITLENLDGKVLDFAKSQNMDGAKVAACSADKASADEVQQALAFGHALSVSATPTLFINGRKLEGALDWGVLQQLLQIEIDHQAEIAKASAKTTASVMPAKSAKDDEKCCTVEVPTLGAKK